MLIGRLGNDPEVRYTPSGANVANFNLATNEVWNDKEGQKKEKTEWHRIVVWGRQAELAGQYLKKGRQVYIEGSLQTRQWEDKDGNKRYTTEVRATNMQFLGSASGERSMGESTDYSSDNSKFEMNAKVEEPSFTDDDIPF